MSRGLVFSRKDIAELVAEKEAQFDALIQKITHLQTQLFSEERKLFDCIDEKRGLLRLSDDE